MAEDTGGRTEDPSGWLIVRRDGTVVTAERRACALLGAPDPDALAGREWTSIVASPGGPDVRAVGRTFASGGTWEGALRFCYARDEVTLAVAIAPVARSSELMVMSLQPTEAAPPRGAGGADGNGSDVAPALPRSRAYDDTAPPASSLSEASPLPEASHDDLKSLVAAYEAMHDLDDAPAVARSVLQAIESGIGFDWGAVLRFDPGPPVGIEVIATYPTPMAGVARGVRWTPADPDEALVHSTGEPSLQGDLRQHLGGESPLDRLPAFGLRSRILVPLYAGPDVVGALALFRHGTLAFTPAEGVVAERTVRRLGEALVRAASPRVDYAPPPTVPAPTYVPPIPAPSAGGATAPAEPAAPTPPAPIAPIAPGTPSRDPAEEARLISSRLESLGELVAGVAHELNNPLTAILGYAQILGGLEGTEREHALRTIEDEAQRAARIVRNLLSFARQRPGQRRLVNVEEMLRRVIDLRRYALEVDDVRVITRFGLVRDVEVDEGQFEQVFLNLLNNAQQALQGAPQQGGEVTVSTWQDAGHVYVAFADNGPGVPEELRARIFEPFFTTREVGHGQGMGLAIVYGVVAHHGGRAWVESNASGGATFVIELPLPQRPPESSDRNNGHAGSQEGGTPSTVAVAPPTVLAPRANQSARRVLVVDDEEPVRALTREILGATGFEVETADGGEQALRLLESSTFDLVITDLRMPGMDGASLYQEVLRRWPAMEHRVLFVTGDIEGEPTGRTLDSSTIRYLEKPFTTTQLLAAVQDVLGGQPAPQA